MFKVSSLIHRHQNYVVDVGSPKKQKEWLDKMHALIRRVIDQAKMGRLMSMPALSQATSSSSRELRGCWARSSLEFGCALSRLSASACMCDIIHLKIIN